ncbi:MAG: protein adenylyltransferase SelO family protein, partial [Cyanobacteria bacterium P01_F01_bin.42]
ESLLQFYDALVKRTAQLVAQWMSVGFCHAVLNTDNMSITGESFDYGPFAYIPTLDSNFTAAYFDHYGRYSYGNQPGICQWNLEMLQAPLSLVMPKEAMQSALDDYGSLYYDAYRQRMCLKLGLPESSAARADSLLRQTLKLLESTQVGYSEFFAEVRELFSSLWLVDSTHILSESALLSHVESSQILEHWRSLYHQALSEIPEAELGAVEERLGLYNPITVPLRPVIEKVWAPIATDDDWRPLYELLRKIQARH